MFFTQTTANQITHFDYKTEKFTNYPIPTLLALPLGLIYYKNYLWFAEFGGQKVSSSSPAEHDLCKELTRNRLAA